MRGLRKIIKELRPWTFLSGKKRWAGFLLCLLLSLFFWFIITLDLPSGYTKEYTIPLEAPLLPGKYTLTDSTEMPPHMTVGLRAGGGKLFRYSLRNLFYHPTLFRPQVDTSKMSSSGGILELTTRGLCEQLLQRGILPPGTTEILEDSVRDITIDPERILLHYEPLKERMAEVLFSGQVDFGKSANLKLVDTVGIIPKRVKVYGAKSALDSLRKAEGAMVVHTDTTLIKIGNPGRILLPISVMPVPGLRVYPDTVFVSLVAEELVHTTITIRNIEVRGLDRHHTLQLLPSTVKVTTLVPRTRVGESPYIPRLYVDASEVIGASPDYRLEVQISNIPDKSEVEMIQLDPDRLDFILEEKVRIPDISNRQNLGTPEGPRR